MGTGANAEELILSIAQIGHRSWGIMGQVAELARVTHFAPTLLKKVTAWIAPTFLMKL